MKKLINYFTILSILITTLKLGMMGWISAEQVVAIMLIAVFILAIKNKGMKVLTAIISLFLFAASYAGGSKDVTLQLMSMIGALALAFYGFYFIFSAMLGGGGKKK